LRGGVGRSWSGLGALLRARVWVGVLGWARVCLRGGGGFWMSALVVPLRRVRIENFRGVRALELALDPEVTVIFGGNAGARRRS
jgi:hypothetical protein